MSLDIFIALKRKIEKISVVSVGISSQTRYQQQEIPIYLDDLIIILTDGVKVWSLEIMKVPFMMDQKIFSFRILLKKHKHMHKIS